MRRERLQKFIEQLTCETLRWLLLLTAAALWENHQNDETPSSEAKTPDKHPISLSADDEERVDL